MRAVLGMTTVGVNQLLLHFDATRLHILEDIDVAFVGRDKEIAVFDEDEDVENLFTIVHDVSEQGNQVTRLVLLHHLLLLDELF